MYSFVKYIILIFFTALSLDSVAQLKYPADTFPDPPAIPNMLFYLQRQPNNNTIVVELNQKNGVVDEDHPVHVYWIRYQERGQKQELNFIQKTFAYGMQSKKLSDNLYELNFVSYKKMKIRLEKGSDNKWRAFTNPGSGSNLLLKKIYIHINGGSFWKPNVEYVEFRGIDQTINKEVRSRISIHQ